MKTLSKTTTFVVAVAFFTCLCLNTDKCTTQKTHLYAQDELHIPGIYLSGYFKKCIKKPEGKTHLPAKGSSYTSLATNDTTPQPMLNQYGVHVPAYIRKQLSTAK